MALLTAHIGGYRVTYDQGDGSVRIEPAGPDASLTVSDLRQFHNFAGMVQALAPAPAKAAP